MIKDHSVGLNCPMKLTFGSTKLWLCGDYIVIESAQSTTDVEIRRVRMRKRRLGDDYRYLFSGPNSEMEWE